MCRTHYSTDRRLLLKCAITVLAAGLLALASCSSGGGEAEVVKPLVHSTITSEATEVPLLMDWRGTYPVSELKRLPEGQRDSTVGFIADAKLFASVWAAFKPGEALPTVDFHKHVVVFARNTRFFNRTSIVKTTLADGVLTVLTMETRSANPIEDKAAMAMLVVPRVGVSFIQTGEKLTPLGSQQ